MFLKHIHGYHLFHLTPKHQNLHAEAIEHVDTTSLGGAPVTKRGNSQSARQKKEKTLVKEISPALNVPMVRLASQQPAYPSSSQTGEVESVADYSLRSTSPT